MNPVRKSIASPSEASSLAMPTMVGVPQGSLVRIGQSAGVVIFRVDGTRQHCLYDRNVGGVLVFRDLAAACAWAHHRAPNGGAA